MTSFGWSISPLAGGRYRYVYDFTKTRGPRLGTLGIQLPSWCASVLASCVDLSSVNTQLIGLPLATFSTTASWFDFGTAEADGIALTQNPFSGLRLDFTDFESGDGPDGTGLATLTWRVSFDAGLAPVWGNFFGSPLLSEEEGEGGGGGHGGGPGHDTEGEDPGGALSPTACLIDYGIPPDPITGETEIPGPPRAYNCGAFYRGTMENGAWVATPGAVVPEPPAPALLLAGVATLGLVARRRRRTTR